jgi:hypothetical protein
VLWVLLGWRFTLAEFVGGIVLIVLMTVLLRLFVSRRLEEEARRHAQTADAGHVHPTAASTLPWRRRVVSLDAWTDVAYNFRGDWEMLWKEIGAGFLLAGFIGLVPNHIFDTLFLQDAPTPVRLLENVVVGPLVAVFSFVCSVGNIPLAAVLWSGGISFAGVIAFIFADLIVLPIILIYRKYYGGAFTVRIVALMFVTMAAAALAIDGIFSAAGLIPQTHPDRSDVFMPVGVDYKLVLNAIGTAVFALLFGLTARTSAVDPVCGMTVDRRTAPHAERDGRTYVFCGDGCRRAFLAGEAQHGHAHAH